MCGVGIEALEAIVSALAVDEMAVDVATHVRYRAAAERILARLAVAAHRLDQSGVWGEDGSTSLVAALVHHGEAHRGEAAGSVKTGRLCDRVPELRERALDRQLSAGQVRVIVDHVPRWAEAIFAEHAAELLPMLEPLSVAATAAAMRVWLARAEAISDRPEPKPEQRRELHLTRSDGGDWLGRFRLDAEGGAIVKRALELALTNDVEGEPPRNPAWRRADALVDGLRFLLNHHERPPTGRNHPHLDLVITWDGGPLAPARFGDDMITRTEVIARYLCDARIHRVLTDAEGLVLDYGREERTAPAHVFRALVVQDQHCRFPGCDRPPAWCEAHHVWPWEDGGPTDLGNLVLLCSRHHHLVHEGGFQLRLRPDRHVEVTSPHGRVSTSDPPGRNSVNRVDQVRCRVLS